jgi:hypothetical protein
MHSAASSSSSTAMPFGRRCTVVRPMSSSACPLHYYIAGSHGRLGVGNPRLDFLQSKAGLPEYAGLLRKN